MEAIIAPTGYGDTIGILKGQIQHLHITFLCKFPLSRYFFNFLYLRFWFLWRSLLVHLFVPSFLPVAFLSRISLCLTMDSLALNVFEVLNLTDREAVVHDLEDDTGGVSQTSRTICLVFRILSPRTIKLEWFEDAMRNAWITRGPLTFSEYGSGMFMVEFHCEGDMRRVLEGQPWHFDHCLVTCANHAGLDTLLPNHLRYSPFWIQVHSIPFGQKSLKLAKLIGDEVGDFLEVDQLTLHKISGLFLRVCVLIDISKPITRGIMVDFKSIHRQKWLTFKYENLPNICYHCGLFDHTLTKCITYLQKCDDRAYPPALPYKIPLKAPAKSTFKRNPFDLSNSFPLDELPAQQDNVDQSLVAVVSQFLTTEDIGSGSSGAASRGNVTEIGSLGVDHGSPLSHDGFHSAVLCDLPFTTTQHATVTASESSSEGLAMEGVIPRTSEKAKGKAVAGAKRAAFLPQTVVVGDSLRNILKRARVGPTIADVSSAINLSLSLMSWNARGLGSPRAFRNLSLFVKNHKPNFLFIMETKAAAGRGDSLCRSLPFDHVFEVPRVGLGGGGTHVSCYYGSPYSIDKMHSWLLLERLFDNAPLLPWLILGDFNDYLSLSDRSSSSNPPSYAMTHFQSFVSKFSLLPLNPIGSKYTWKHGNVCERLDWGVVNHIWQHTFPHTTLYHLAFYGSDHRVLKITLNDDSMIRLRHKRFMFENFWLTEPSFYDTVRGNWNHSHLGQIPLTLNTFLLKQKTCVDDIKSWNAGFNSLSRRIHALESSINAIHSNLPLSSDKIQHASALQSQLDSLLYKNEILWKQRSKSHWLQAGDKNTKYFHSKATVRRKTNFIRKLKCNDGRVVTSFDDISREVSSYFGDLFKSPESNSEATQYLLSAIDKSVDSHQIHFLDSPFEAHEVKQALFQLSGDKAPGLDGLNPTFYQKN
ncbi:uncharacterized protein LOC133033413 [Cannabis sativa]|uniref:uncharacterized protein LOC133033413 n=1 Tax=Cannabis sativa TaxID=3483 RepID=UPI0029CAA54E|nr:uncharacterized protein LOC133033413 [Cannabis sativa]